jgi:predicted RNA-binding Zn ribbon-like protein
MSKASRKFRVPDPLAELYDFANTLDLRSFQHRGVRMQPSDEIESPPALGAWLVDHKLAKPGALVRPEQLERAHALRTQIRALLDKEPAARRTDRAAIAGFNAIAQSFPLMVQLGGPETAALATARDDTLGGLSVVVSQLYDSARNGKLDRLKMCDAAECKRVFYDRSKPGTRRWCQSTMCGNRMKTRAYRERQRA